MGLIKSVVGSAGGVLADSWREFFYCDSLEADVLVCKGQKRTSEKRTSNTKGEPNIISNGSVIAVNEGQCMMIVESGAIVEVCAEPGEFVYDKSTSPSLFYGGLGKGIKESFAQFGYRFGFGGDTGKDQRVYYFNTKEIIGNKFGTASPIPFRIVDTNIGLDMDVSVRCNGVYSYRLDDPILFYKKVCGNVEEPYTRDKIDAQLKSELLGALQPAFGSVSAMGIRYSAIPAHVSEFADALNEVLDEEWKQARGIVLEKVGINSINASEEDEQAIKDLQRAGALRDPAMREANLSASAGDSMRHAAQNEAGAFNGFIGMGMAGNMGGSMMSGLTGQGYVPQNNYGIASDGGFGVASRPVSVTPMAGGQGGSGAFAAGVWICSCGTQNTGKFCGECGSPMPAPVASEEWLCACGTSNTGKFCGECGSPKPAPSADWTCSCGTTNTGKFCSNCGSKRP